MKLLLVKVSFWKGKKDSQTEESSEAEFEVDEELPPQQSMTEDLFDQVEVDEEVPEDVPVEEELPAIPGETPAKDDSEQSKATTSTSTSTTTTTTTTTTEKTTSTTTTTSTSTSTDEETPASESVSLESLSDDSLLSLADDNLDVLADEVGEEIGEFEYGLENESLPKPPTPQELRNAIVNEGMFTITHIVWVIQNDSHHMSHKITLIVYFLDSSI